MTELETWTMRVLYNFLMLYEYQDATHVAEPKWYWRKCMANKYLLVISLRNIVSAVLLTLVVIIHNLIVGICSIPSDS